MMSTICQLDVGAQLFKVTSDTLSKYPDSVLAKMFDPNKGFLKASPDHPLFMDR